MTSPVATEVEGPRTLWVLDRLVVGVAPTHLTGLFVITDKPAHALRVFRLGATAVVPSFEVADDVLRLAGWTEDVITLQGRLTRGEVEWDGTF